MRRFAIANQTLFFGCELVSLSGVPCPEGLTAVQWSENDLLQHQGEEHYLDESHATWLGDGRAICFAVMDEEKLAGFAWIALGDVPGEMNHDGHPDTQLPLFLPDDTGFVFHVFILPAYRGQRLYAALMSYAAEQLPDHGVGKLLLTTECTNRSALRSVNRMGFREVGRAWLIKVGPICSVGYPEQPFFGGVRTGAYVGDLHERIND
ncbi:MAG: N-acetyltransferase [Rhodopirellula sp.]|uniref:Ribosomal-protein-alanine acetyltransferase n=3 Tax=Pirellulaceae TaxID=2691357 RepID=M5RZJ1_9BACT|nr:ribosomal-protein-alanine acetyltransferase [Rhodopirellula europaea SH398]MAP09831.1 N-acetyltransferase [Rhodopirellula sp.]PHQ34983.1 N-acetyltransferase [Rhodopirellula bahusiensis]